MKTITGNLLDITRGTIMHQVNCRGFCGGLAGALRRKWPEAFKIYDRGCAELGDAALGTTWIGDAKKGDHRLRIAHVFGQLNPGPFTLLPAVECAFANMVNSGFRNITLYAPYLMGCGLGGGDWTQYSALIEKHLPETIIVKLP